MIKQEQGKPRRPTSQLRTNRENMQGLNQAEDHSNLRDMIRIQAKRSSERIIFCESDQLNRSLWLSSQP